MSPQHQTQPTCAGPAHAAFGRYLALPWLVFDVHAAPWTVTARVGEHEASLSGPELLDALAAFELGREPQEVVHATLRARARYPRRRITMEWASLVGDGVPMLRSRSDAPGQLPLGVGLRRLGLALTDVRYG